MTDEPTREEQRAYFEQEYDAMTMVFRGLAHYNAEEARRAAQEGPIVIRHSTKTQHAKAVERRKKRKRGGHK